MALTRRTSDLLKPFTTAAAVSFNPLLRRAISPSSATTKSIPLTYRLFEPTPNRDGTGVEKWSFPILKKMLGNSFQHAKFGTQADISTSSQPGFSHQSEASLTFPTRCFSVMVDQVKSVALDDPSFVSGVAPRIKFKRPDKTARHIMQILDKEAVEEVKSRRELPDIQPGYIIQMKVEVPDNKRRNSILKGIVIARRNAGLNTTFRLRRLVAGVGIESLFPLYSPNIKEIKVLDKKKVRRAKLYYLRDKMNPLKKR